MGINANLTREQLLIQNLDRENSRAQLNRRLIADGSGGASASSSAAGVVPKVTGLTLTQVTGGIEVRWTDVNLRDLLRYDVQVAKDTAFSDSLSTTRIRDNRILLEDLDPAITYFVRVRAINAAGQAGAYSGILDTTTGLIVTADITLGDINEFVEATDSTWVTLDTNNETDDSDWVDVTIERAGERVSAAGFLAFDFDSTHAGASDENDLTIRLFRRADGATTAGSQIGDAIVIDFFSDVPDTTGSATATAPIVFPLDDPGVGNFEYSFQLETNITGSSTLAITPAKLIMQFQIFKA